MMKRNSQWVCQLLMSNRSIKAGERRTINGLRNPSLACVPRGVLWTPAVQLSCGRRHSWALLILGTSLRRKSSSKCLSARASCSRQRLECWGKEVWAVPCTRLSAHASFPSRPGCLVVEEREGGWTHNHWVQGLATLPPTHSLPASETPYLSQALTALRGSPFILCGSQIACLSVSLSPFFFFSKLQWY